MEFRNVAMSKRALKKYISEMPREPLEDLVTLLYDKFKPVKVYFDFVFAPQTQKMVDAAKVKIEAEYFPKTLKRAKLRRTVAKNFIKHFISLEMAPEKIIELMFFNIQLQLKYSRKRYIRHENFYKGTYANFVQLIKFSIQHGFYADNQREIAQIIQDVEIQNWPNAANFADIHTELLSKSEFQKLLDQ